jgi:toxin-antitoxin system PIN domain toxin
MELMILIDVNILVYAHRPDAIEHSRYFGWLQDALNSEEICGLSELALAGMVRIVTHPQIYPKPTPVDLALNFAQELRDDEGTVIISPGPRHWEVFARLCRASGAKGNLVSDAYFAALAIESGAEWITADRDYARFPGLRWRHPLA